MQQVIQRSPITYTPTQHGSGFEFTITLENGRTVLIQESAPTQSMAQKAAFQRWLKLEEKGYEGEL